MKFIYIIIAAFALASCRSPIDDGGGPGNDNNNNRQLVYFQYDYINYAWGFQHFGWYLDSAGALRKYEFKDKDRAWNYPDSLGYISQEALMRNLAQTTLLANAVNKDSLDNYFAISQTLGVHYSEPEQRAADAGAAAFFAYRWDPSKKMYRQILISQSGDWERHNLSPHTDVLERWLISIGEANPPFFWLRD